VQEIIPLEQDEGELKLTVAYYYLPSGRLVHRKKGATDWGVEPQIIVPMSEKDEARVLQQQGEEELFHKPLPLTSKSPTQPATQSVVDVQLQEAVSAIVASTLMDGGTVAPATQTARGPSTQPAGQ
jgi:hypothetical protein